MSTVEVEVEKEVESEVSVRRTPSVRMARITKNYGRG